MQATVIDRHAPVVPAARYSLWENHMGPDIQDTLLRLFEQVRQDPDTVPVVSIDEWHEGAAERHLLTGFCDMLERLQEHHQDKLETRERFSLAVQGANDGLWDRHFDTGEYHLSTRWKSMLGYEDHEISDNVEEWDKRIHPDDVDRVSEAGQAYRDGRTDS